MRPELITFDCYGTLIDWRSGITRALQEEVPESADVGEAELFAAYHAVEAELEGGGYRRYREVLREAARRLAARFGWRLENDGVLADSLPSWPPFSDTNPALERLKAAGYRLGILSNVDDDLLAGTRRHFAVDFDVLVTAEQVKSYKPKPAHFLRAIAEVAGDAGRLLHMAESHYYDVQAAVPLNIPVVWVNRTGERHPEGPHPTAEVRDLRGAVEWVDSVSAD